MFNQNEQQNPPVVAQNSELPSSEQAEQQKRNSGRTGPTSSAGLDAIKLNARRHGCTAKTLILPEENEADYDELLSIWKSMYPGDHPLLHHFIVRTAQAVWFQLRCQREFDEYRSACPRGGIYNLIGPEEYKKHDLMMRYLGAAERRMHREYKALEYFYEKRYKTTCIGPQPKPAKEPEPAETEAEVEEPELEEPCAANNWHMPTVAFLNPESGNKQINGVNYPPEPDYVPQKTVAGVYPPNHLKYWKNNFDPKRFKKHKRK